MPLRVTVGGVVSLTITVLSFVPVLPAISVLLYVKIYVPSAQVFTDQLISITVQYPSVSSVHVAQDSI